MARKARRTRQPEAAPPSPVRGTRVRLYALCLAVAGVLAYINSLDAPFVFDDTDAILNNPHVLRLWPLTAAMTAPPQSAVSGRPVVSVSLAISHAWNGLAPAAFRVWNIAVLVGSALLLFGILRRSFRRAAGDAPGTAAWTAFACALLWLLHPLQTEVIDYVIQRTESMMGFFYLLTMYASIRVMASEGGSPRWMALAIAACAAGMGCKESMVTAPVMVLLYDLGFEARSFSEAFTRRRTLYLGLAATWLVLAAAIIEAPRFRSAGFSTSVSSWTYLLNQAVMIVTYLKLAVWPHPLVLDYGRTGSIAFTAALPYAFVIVALLAATFAMWTIRPAVGFLGTWFFVTLAPSSSFVPIATEVGAERRMYLPLAAIVVLLVILSRWAASRWFPQVRHGQVVAAVVALAAGLGALTVARNQEYRDPIGIWESVLARRPHARAHYNLGIELKKAGRAADAMEQYRTSVEGEPAAHYALGFELGTLGRFDEAERELREFIRLQPEDARAPQASYLLGQSLVSLGRHAEAEQAFRETLRMRPRDADARSALADVLLAQQKHEEAIAMYKEFLAMVPGSADAHHNLGLAFVAQHQEALALNEFETAAKLNPNDANLRQSYGNALVTADRYGDAAAQFRAGLALAPNDPQMMAKLALTLVLTGGVDEPMALFRRALQLAPNDPDVQALYNAAVTQLRRPM